MFLTKRETRIRGCFELQPKRFTDARGVFVKTFQRELFTAQGLDAEFDEDYYSVSEQGVLRGLHFQMPPFDHNKLVYCLAGEIFDAVLDLRRGSSTFGDFETLRLSGENANMVYVPKGVAHGFYTLTPSATVMYKVSTAYSPKHDTGILWSSAGISWPNLSPRVSVRDASFLSLSEFESPFLLQQESQVGA
jgi:dTDP-4-dehydrorhamnose 3,5-epimerase